MNRFAFARPRTIEEAGSIASATVADAMVGARPDAALIKAGGIDLLDLMKENLVAPATVVSLGGIPGLDAIADENGGLRIGPMVTLAALAANGAVRDRYPALAAAAGSSASPQLRNVATIGGNLLQRPRCWYFRSDAYHCLRKGGGHCFALSGENQYHAIFDNHSCAIVHPSTAATVLVALGASVELTGGKAVRRLVLEDFFVPPDRDLQRENDLRPRELLSAIYLPALPPGTRMAHLKQGEKDSFDWPLADVAVVLSLGIDGSCNRASVVLGAAAPIPHRAKTAEAVLTGRKIDAAAAREAARAALEGATPLAKNAYKLPLFETLVRRSILAAAQEMRQRPTVR
jgi:xanthine dehydrogenase YagS FAD-binding subunit